MKRVKVSKKFQIAIPSEVRQKLGIAAGDVLLVDVRGDHVLLMPEPKNWAEALWGFQKEIWEGVDAVAYVRELRGECEAE
jgi:AbrB family looped-hinge helix DNA binding protein